MLYSKFELVKLAVEIASGFELDPALVCAHIDVRSRWDSGLTLPTATYYSAPGRSALESEHRSIQWGLMAIGGEFARSQGYIEPLPALLLPLENLREGCRILRELCLRHNAMEGKEVQALLRWNSQPDRDLVAEILRKMPSYTELNARIPDQPRTFPDADKTLLLTHSQIEENQLL